MNRRNTSWKRRRASWGGELGNRWLISDDELELRHEVHHERPVRTQRVQQGVAPNTHLGVALAEKIANEALKRLRQRRIRDVALVLIELAGRKQARAAAPAPCAARSRPRICRCPNTRKRAPAPASRSPRRARMLRAGCRFRAARPYSFSGITSRSGVSSSASGNVVDPSLGVPLREAPPKVALQRRRCLVALLGGLGEQLHDDCRDDAPVYSFSRSAGGTGCPAMWACTHPIGSDAVNGRLPVNISYRRHAERVEVAARIDRSIHPPGLLRRHVGQCAGNELGRLRLAALARESRRDAESSQPHPTRCPVGHHVGRFDVFVDQAADVQLAECGRQTRANAQCLPDVHRHARASGEHFATRILEDECGLPLSGRQSKGPNRPRGIQFVPQRLFVLEHAKGLRSRMLGPRHDDERGTRRGRICCAAASVQDELTVLENGLEPVGREIQRCCFHAGEGPCPVSSLRRRPRAACTGGFGCRASGRWRTSKRRPDNTARPDRASTMKYGQRRMDAAGL